MEFFHVGNLSIINDGISTLMCITTEGLHMSVSQSITLFVMEFLLCFRSVCNSFDDGKASNVATYVIVVQ